MSLLNDNPEEIAKGLGLEMVLPKDDEVFVDLDDANDIDGFTFKFNRLRNEFPKATYQKIPSRRKDHFHAYVRIPELKPLTMQERVILQAVLGSDIRRELFALLRMRDEKFRKENVSLFFEEPENFRWLCVKAVREGLDEKALTEKVKNI